MQEQEDDCRRSYPFILPGCRVCGEPVPYVETERKIGGVPVKKIADIVKSYVDQNPPDCGNAQDVVDRIFWCYMENNRVDNGKTNACYAALREKVNLPLRDYDEVLYIVSDLSLEYGRLAFMEGLKVGMLLMQELTNR